MNYNTLYRPEVAVGLRISACNAAAEASMRRRLISRTACSTYQRDQQKVKVKFEMTDPEFFVGFDKEV